MPYLLTVDIPLQWGQRWEFVLFTRASHSPNTGSFNYSVSLLHVQTNKQYQSFFSNNPGKPVLGKTDILREVHQFSSVAQPCLTHCNHVDHSHQASLSITNSWNLLKLMSTELMMPSNHLILCCPLLLLPSIFPNIRVFSNESVFRIRWPKY